jgi:hypothetical protein
VLPLVQYTQFPWRLLGFLGFATAILGAVVWSIAVARPTRATHAAMAVLLLVVVGRTREELPPVPEIPVADIPFLPADVAKRMESTVVSDEYLPLTAPSKPLRARTTLIAGVALPVRIEEPRRAGIGVRINAEASGPGFIDLAHHWFPSWQVVTLSGPPGATAGPSPSGLIRIQLPAPGRYDLIVRFGMTRVRVIGLVMSAVAAVLLPTLLLLIARLRRRSEARAA